MDKNIQLDKEVGTRLKMLLKELDPAKEINGYCYMLCNECLAGNGVLSGVLLPENIGYPTAYPPAEYVPNFAGFDQTENKKSVIFL